LPGRTAGRLDYRSSQVAPVLGAPHVLAPPRTGVALRARPARLAGRTGRCAARAPPRVADTRPRICSQRRHLPVVDSLLTAIALLSPEWTGPCPGPSLWLVLLKR